MKLDWRYCGEPTTGRLVHINDDRIGHWSILPDEMTLSDAIQHYSDEYRKTPGIGTVHCEAKITVDGVETESRDFIISE